MKLEVSVASYLGAGTLFLLALLSTFSILSHLNGIESPLAIPGCFFFSTFLWASFFIPVYLLFLAFFLVAEPFKPRDILALNLSLLPFLTMAVFQKVLLAGRIPPSFLPELVVETLGRGPAALLLGLLLLLEILIILRLALSARRPLGDGEAAQALLPVRAVAQLEPPEVTEEAATAEALLRQAGPFAGAPEIELHGPSHPEEVVEVEIEELEAVQDSGVEGGAAAGQAQVGLRRLEPAGGADPAPGPGTRVSDPPPRCASPARGPIVSARGYEFPIQGLLKDYPDGEYWEIDPETEHAAEILKTTLEEFKITAQVTGIRKGPVITMFEILPAPGVKISRIVNLADNIALRLAASRVRIVAPIPGKHAVGIEVPNRKRAIVSFKEVVSLHDFQKSKFEIPIALGKDIAGGAQMIDLTQTPHILIAGATGSGKSVCVNSIICSILYKKSPAEVRFLLVDPKIVELKIYNDIPHLLTPVVTDPKRAFQALQYCLSEMERRYSLLDALGVRDIRAFNRKAGSSGMAVTKLPYLVIVVDEFADLIATTGKEMEAALARLAAMARAVGIHLVLATQRPSIDVITGLIKANIPSRIAFMVASKFDSRIIIDAVGAEKLLGQGDMLFSAAWDPILMRIQGAFLCEEEIIAITTYARTLGEPEYLDDEIFFDDGEEEFFTGDAEDPMMDKALETVLASGKASASYLQRRLKIGYNRAARLVEEMESRGIVGPANGSKPREILHVPDRPPAGGG